MLIELHHVSSRTQCGDLGEQQMPSQELLKGMINSKLVSSLCQSRFLYRWSHNDFLKGRWKLHSVNDLYTISASRCRMSKPDFKSVLMVGLSSPDLAEAALMFHTSSCVHHRIERQYREHSFSLTSFMT